MSRSLQGTPLRSPYTPSLYTLCTQVIDNDRESESLLFQFAWLVVVAYLSPETNLLSANRLANSLVISQAIVQQPGAVPQMNAGGNRNVLNKPYDPQGHRDWSYGTFTCFDEPGTCLFSWCCSCFSYGKNMSRLKYLQANGHPHPKGGEMVNSDCVTYGALLYCGECSRFLASFFAFLTHVDRVYFWANN